MWSFVFARRKREQVYRRAHGRLRFDCFAETGVEGGATAVKRGDSLPALLGCFRGRGRSRDRQGALHA